MKKPAKNKLATSDQSTVPADLLHHPETKTRISRKKSLRRLRRLKGIAGPVPSGFDYKEAIYEYLMVKYK